MVVAPSLAATSVTNLVSCCPSTAVTLRATITLLAPLRPRVSSCYAVAEGHGGNGSTSEFAGVGHGFLCGLGELSAAGIDEYDRAHDFFCRLWVERWVCWVLDA
jgi:hypothetical protein